MIIANMAQKVCAPPSSPPLNMIIYGELCFLRDVEQSRSVHYKSKQAIVMQFFLSVQQAS